MSEDIDAETLARVRVMVVDELEWARNPLLRLLELRGLRAIGCGDTEKALAEVAGPDPVAVAFVNSRAAGRDGFEAARHIHEASPRTLVYVITPNGILGVESGRVTRERVPAGRQPAPATSLGDLAFDAVVRYVREAQEPAASPSSAAQGSRRAS